MAQRRIQTRVATEERGLWAADSSVLEEWERLCELAPEQMEDCSKALLESPYPDYPTYTHSRVKDMRQLVGPEPAWEWRVGESYVVFYRHSPRGPEVFYAGERR
jgi:hypothetical protein